MGIRNPRDRSLLTINAVVYADHLREVMSEMKKLGPPRIRVVDCGDSLMAIEGTHRLAAAELLGLVPEFEILDHDERLDVFDLDADILHGKADEDGTMRALDIAWMLKGSHNGEYFVGEDGRLEADHRYMYQDTMQQILERCGRLKVDHHMYQDTLQQIREYASKMGGSDISVPVDINDIEKVSEIVWDANTPEEARELAEEAGIVGEENLKKAEGIWFRDEWKHGTDTFEELFPTYGEGSRATDPNDYLEDDFRSIVDGELSVRDISDWWKDYGKRFHDVEETIREFGLVYDGDTDGDFETRVRQLEAWLNEHTVEPLVPFVTPPECQGQTVEYSYSLVNNRGNTFIIEREHDHGDGEIIHRLYVDGDPDGDFDPQNGAPKLGEFVGQVAVEEQTFPTPEELAAMKADRIRL